MNPTVASLHQALKELDREDLELYALGIGLMYAEVCEALGSPGGVTTINQFGMDLKTRKRIRQLSQQVSERVRELHIRAQ